VNAIHALSQLSYIPDGGELLLGREKPVKAGRGSS